LKKFVLYVYFTLVHKTNIFEFFELNNNKLGIFTYVYVYKRNAETNFINEK